jgi:hypothetical protein
MNMFGIGKMGAKGQVTIYVIIGLVIVGLAVLGVMFFPEIRNVVSGDFNPDGFLETCIEPEVRQGINVLSAQGGYLNPEGFVLYEGKKVKYLCYSSEYYQTCIVQDPMVKNSFESELKGLVLTRAEECGRQLSSEYKNRGFEVSSGDVSVDLSLEPGRARFLIEAPLTVTKETTETFRDFEIDVDTEIYDLLLISQSIIDFESTYGDSETTNYLQYYPDLSIGKIKLQDGTTIYKVSNVVTTEEFTFASRSLAWPAGYLGATQG